MFLIVAITLINTIAHIVAIGMFTMELYPVAAGRHPSVGLGWFFVLNEGSFFNLKCETRFRVTE